MSRYWVYFRGTRNGEWIQAPAMKTAKLKFAKQTAEREGIQHTEEQFEAQINYICCAMKGLSGHGDE